RGRLARPRERGGLDPPRAPMIRPAPFAIALGTVFGVLVTLQPVSDSDLFWHVATGRRTLELALPRVDLFSWTIAGLPVFTDQWLGDAVLAAARAAADWRGVLAIRALAVAALVAIVVDTALAARPRAPLVAALAALPAVALSRFAWTDRPELLGLLCFAILIALVRAVRRGSLTAFALCVPLVLLWTNLHGSYALGLGLVLVVAVERAVVDPSRRRRY